jgi:DNA-binding NtrC family response regulator
MPPTASPDHPRVRVRAADPAVAEVLRAVLELAGYAVDDGPAPDAGADPCCALVDTWAPGWEAAVAALRAAHGPALPVLLIGTDEHRAATDVGTVGAVGFVALPVDIDDLGAAVRVACASGDREPVPD